MHRLLTLKPATIAKHIRDGKWTLSQVSQLLEEMGFDDRLGLICDILEDWEMNDHYHNAWD